MLSIPQGKSEPRGRSTADLPHPNAAIVKKASRSGGPPSASTHCPSRLSYGSVPRAWAPGVGPLLPDKPLMRSLEHDRALRVRLRQVSNSLPRLREAGTPGTDYRSFRLPGIRRGRSIRAPRSRKSGIRFQGPSPIATRFPVQAFDRQRDRRPRRIRLSRTPQSHGAYERPR